MVLLLGTGFGKTVLVLTLLALPAILTATAAGIHGADREAVHAARALGMSEGQVISKVEWPLALPLVISGLRSATLQVVATATVAAFVGGGGLGRLLISGQRSGNYPQMFAGRVPDRADGHRARSAARAGRLAGRPPSPSAAARTIALLRSGARITWPNTSDDGPTLRWSRS